MTSPASIALFPPPLPPRMLSRIPPFCYPLPCNSPERRKLTDCHWPNISNRDPQALVFSLAASDNPAPQRVVIVGEPTRGSFSALGSFWACCWVDGWWYREHQGDVTCVCVCVCVLFFFFFFFFFFRAWISDCDCDFEHWTVKCTGSKVPPLHPDPVRAMVPAAARPAWVHAGHCSELPKIIS